MLKKVSFWVIIGSLFVSSLVYLYYPNDGYKANIVVNSICIGITAGLIDIFANIIPINQKKKTAKKILNKNMNWLLFEIEQIISTTLLVFNIKKTWKNVELKDVSGENGKINQLNGNIQHVNELIVTGFSIYENKKNKRKTGFRHAPVEYNEFIKGSIRTIKEFIEKITPFEYFYNSDVDFVEQITRLKYCDFL